MTTTRTATAAAKARAELAKLAATAQNDVDDLRDRIADLNRQRATIEAAPHDVETVMASVDAAIAEARAFGLPEPMAYAVQPGGMFTAGRFDEAMKLSPFRTLAVLLPDHLRAGLAAAFTAETKGGLSPAERTTRLREVRDLLEQAEAAEEGAIRELEAAGIPIQRRPNADPRVVLAPDHELTP